MEKILYETRDPGYGRIRVVDTEVEEKPVRELLVNGAAESVFYRDPHRRYDLYSDYLQGFNWVFSLQPHSRKTLLIGGGGFAYPSYYLHHYPEKEIDVVEMNPLMLTLARKYFGFDEFYPEGEPSPGLGVYITDAMEYLKECDVVYDVILNDAYIGRSFDRDLVSETGILEVKRHLTKEGIYAMNVVAVPRGPMSFHLNRLMRRLQKVFRYTMLLQAREEESPWVWQNCLVFASDVPFGM